MAGASPPKRGRPKKDEAVVRIRLTKHIYDMWTTKKDSVGFSTKTHSEFAEYLMMNTYEGLSIQTPSSGKSKYFMVRSPCYYELYTACI